MPRRLNERFEEMGRHLQGAKLADERHDVFDVYNDLKQLLAVTVESIAEVRGDIEAKMDNVGFPSSTRVPELPTDLRAAMERSG